MQTSSSSNGPCTQISNGYSLLAPQKVIHKAAKHSKLRRRRLNLNCNCIVYQHPTCLEHGFSHRGVTYIGQTEFRRICLGTEAQKETSHIPELSSQRPGCISCEDMAISVSQTPASTPNRNSNISIWNGHCDLWDALFQTDSDLSKPTY
uniref:Transcriptional activator protein n=1 Tax=Begomovirus spathoglottis 2 TaxID=3064731 RepID=A0AA49QBH1_9GEMI|nr:AL2 [Begomovirus spathoglottis 2]